MKKELTPLEKELIGLVGDIDQLEPLVFDIIDKIREDRGSGTDCLLDSMLERAAKLRGELEHGTEIMRLFAYGLGVALQRYYERPSEE